MAEEHRTHTASLPSHRDMGLGPEMHREPGTESLKLRGSVGVKWEARHSWYAEHWSVLHLAWLAEGQSGLTWGPQSLLLQQSPPRLQLSVRLRMASSGGRMQLSQSGRIANCPSPASPSWIPGLRRRDLGMGGCQGEEVPVIESGRMCAERPSCFGLMAMAWAQLPPPACARRACERHRSWNWSKGPNGPLGSAGPWDTRPCSEASSVKRAGGREGQGHGYPVDRETRKSEGRRRTQVMRGDKRQEDGVGERKHEGRGQENSSTGTERQGDWD